MNQYYIYIFMLFLMMILLLIMILISVAFLTLMERKFLGYIQERKGPNKLGINGIMQPFSDAIKLLSKEFYILMNLNFYIYLVSPIFGMVLIIMMWLIYPMKFNYLSLNLGFLYLICCFSFSIYSLLMSGWSSNSSYSMLGSIRSLAQSISYEVSLVIILLIPMLLIDGFNFINFGVVQSDLSFYHFLNSLSMLFFFSILAELNRTPFDFSEGESELVSGFNVEYMSSGFTLIFLAEYSSILFLSFVYSLIFMGGDILSGMFYISVFSVTFVVIWIRGSFPRFRYDLLMYLCWLVILPISLNYLFFMIFLKILIFK